MRNFLLCLCLVGLVFANESENAKLEAQCEAGDTDKCFELAWNLQNSCEKTPNFEVGAKAISIYEKICNSNKTPLYGACLRLAEIYGGNNCTQKNQQKSLQYMKMSCDKENVTNVCTFYQRSSETIEKFKTDCKNGDTKSCDWLKSQGY